MNLEVVSELVMQHGVVAIAFGFMLIMSNKRHNQVIQASTVQLNKMMEANTKREERLMEFTKEISEKQGEISAQMFMIRSDVADLRRNQNKEVITNG